MPGWSTDKRNRVESAFYKYLDRCWINSRDGGRVCLGKNIYQGQKRVITQIFDGLEDDKHEFYILKSRQLGISTVIRALNIFWMGVFPGLKGAIVFDTDNNKTESRAELEVMIEELPTTLQFPTIKTSNRAGLTLANNSKVLFMSAGVKKSKSSGTLGRSVGLAAAHGSELCSWDNEEGWEAFHESLSDTNPDRIYIWESTARGFNFWWTLWQEARNDPAHKVCIFIGWWAKDSQKIEKTHPDYALYGETPPTDKEKQRIIEVRDRYGVDITPEQLAWIRRKYDPTATREGDADPEFEASALRMQEQPWTEDDAFQQTGSIFFPADKLTEITHNHVSAKFSTYMFLPGAEFTDMQIIKAPNTRNIDLKVWEEPVQDGVYVMGVDPAFGENEYNDRSSIEILRCYADGIDQVAEYASPLINTRQLAWVVASLLGWYGSEPNTEIKYALELNGPGTAVFNELKSLRHLLESGYRQQQVEEKGLKNIFRNVRTYIWTRPDSMGVGQNYHLKTTGPLKITFLERMRDFVTNGTFRIRSLDLVEEMKTIAREGDSIKAPGSMKDDRVLASSFGIHIWETGVRKQLVTQRRTRDAEAARKRMSIVDQAALFHQNQLQNFFGQKHRIRIQEQRMAIRQTWRYR